MSTRFSQSTAFGPKVWESLTGMGARSSLSFAGAPSQWGFRGAEGPRPMSSVVPLLYSNCQEILNSSEPV